MYDVYNADKYYITCLQKGMQEGIMLIRYVLSYKICIKCNAKNQKKMIGFFHICVATNIVQTVSIK